MHCLKNNKEEIPHAEELAKGFVFRCSQERKKGKTYPSSIFIYFIITIMWWKKNPIQHSVSTKEMNNSINK